MIEVRSSLVEYLRRDVLGPREERECLSDPPTSTYITGVLYPSGVRPEEEAGETLGMGGEETGADEVSSSADIRQIPLPGSIGLTFVVASEIESLEVHFRYGVYREFREKKRRRWQREQISERSTLPLTIGRQCYPIGKAASLDAVIRDRGELLVVTVFLTNRFLQEGADHADDERCLYQPGIEIRGPQGRAVFLDRRREIPILDLPDEELSSRLLYSEVAEFARGHNCAAGWDGEGQAALAVRTLILPLLEVHPTLPSVSDRTCLDMNFLATALPEEIQQETSELLNEYERWIKDQRQMKLPRLQEGLKGIASRHLAACDAALTRMREGLSLLSQDDAHTAFQFASNAMLLQRSHSQWIQRRCRGEEGAPVLEGRWYPFQLAFLLMNIPPSLDSQHSQRDVVDLLWFPTGGGKTEAYLGVAAFTLALRRLRRGGGDGSGVTVIMRYTLRLLTLQQFQRATTLVCACEILRRRDPERWGRNPFRIGLWVGTRATPKSVLGARRALKSYRDGWVPQEANPVQLTSCPWCGEKLEWRHYRVEKSGDRLSIHCPRPECEFSGKGTRTPDNGIPAVVTDQEIYATRPTLLIGTVDKFAQLPWVRETRSLFGSPGAPPALILMDELHLISGPLGTMTGLYETILDELSTDSGGTRPRYVASTATIRNSGEQCGGLFARRVAQFPPPGLDARDSWFAQEKTGQAGRLFLGINPVGKSAKTALQRVYSALLHQAGVLLRQNQPIDPWWTLVGYFNAIRELAGARPLCEDDVNDRLRGLAAGEGSVENRRIIDSDRISELTGRLTSSEVPEALSALEQPIGGMPPPIDIALASSMISVGLDVPRLGLMVVAGQPKTTSEYIQATSRVGRRHPGLICTVYRWTRPRDISHYEQFISYHSSLYQHVEPTSVTPFAPQARSRGLHALLVALVRHLSGGLPRAADAGRISELPRELRRRILGVVSKRAALTGESSDEVLQEAEGLLDQWCQRAEFQKDLHYGHMRRGDSQGAGQSVLLEPAPAVGDGWATLTSLREVEAPAELYFHKPGMEPEV